MDNPVFVLGAFETALGVVRSLGSSLKREVYVFDNKKDIAFYSRYSKAFIIPDPQIDSKAFLDYIIDKADKQKTKPVLFITSDKFLNVISQNREILSQSLLFNLCSNTTLNAIKDKYLLYKLALNNNIIVPKTFKIENTIDLHYLLQSNLEFPLFLKGLDVNLWREKIHGSLKGFVVKDQIELKKKASSILLHNVPFVAQEIIPGPDTNHYKVCVYYSKKGEQLLNFTLRKIRQNPIHFGVGSVVESLKYPELAELGKKLFDSIEFKGVGSAEFKLDQRDKTLKLIEINPRYWQQNYLSTACGMNFPLMDYLEVLGKSFNSQNNFQSGIKWINRYMDFDSFLEYRKEKSISFIEWRKSLSGHKVYSDFRYNDPFPILFEIGFGKKIFRLPNYLFKKVFGDNG